MTFISVTRCIVLQTENVLRARKKSTKWTKGISGDTIKLNVNVKIVYAV